MAQIHKGDASFIANLAVSAWRGVVLSSNGGITYSGTAAVPHGFTAEDAASGDLVGVHFFNSSGTQKCEITAQPVTVADVLFAGALGRVSPTGTVTVGISRTTSKANASVIEFIPTY